MMTTPGLLSSFLEATLTPSPFIFAIAIVIITLVPVLLHLIITATTPYASLPTILILGPSNAGKTSIAALIERGPDAGRTGSVPDMHTSQVPLVLELTAARGAGYKDATKETISEGSGENYMKFNLIDVPGHGKLRLQAVDRLQPSRMDSAKLRGVIFVVDAAALSDTHVLSASADYLYTVLLALQRRVTPGKQPAPVPVLIAANKQDLFTAIPPAAVRKALEAELTRIRAFRSKGLLDSGVGVEDIGSEEQDAWVGEYGTKSGFDFGQMEEFGVKVQVVGGSVRGEGSAWKGIDAWWSWIAATL